jgi:hypothetical protein
MGHWLADPDKSEEAEYLTYFTPVFNLSVI